MVVMDISFKSKIPIYQNKIYDRQKQSFVDSTMCELDGKDISDIQYILDQDGNWTGFKYAIAMDLYDKYSNNQIEDDSIHVYVLETEDKPIGFAEITTKNNIHDIQFLDCNPEKKYKYTGQTFLASIIKFILKKPNQIFRVSAPVYEARKFYIDKCGFKSVSKNSLSLEMSEKEMMDFLCNIEKKAEIIDIKE